MTGPDGYEHVIHTPLVSWIADYPEQLLLACTAGKQLAVSTTSSASMGNSSPHPPCTQDYTLHHIIEASTAVDPMDIPTFYHICQTLSLNSVHIPFWKDWGNADLSVFLIPDALHRWHKFFFNHPLKWVINTMGGAELDYHLSILQPCTGVHARPSGVLKLKQCTGREHHELQKLLIALAAGAVTVNVLCALQALVEFIFQVQSLLLYDKTIHTLKQALAEFHHYKNKIITSSGHHGKNGPLDHFQIPKLEALHHVLDSICLMGTPYQWTSDITDCCHITLIEIPYHMLETSRRHAPRQL